MTVCRVQGGTVLVGEVSGAACCALDPLSDGQALGLCVQALREAFPGKVHSDYFKLIISSTSGSCSCFLPLQSFKWLLLSSVFCNVNNVFTQAFLLCIDISFDLSFDIEDD